MNEAAAAANGTNAPESRRSFDRIGTRLLFVTIVPITGLLLLAAWLAYGSYREADLARAVNDQVPQLVDISSLQVHIGLERTLTNGVGSADDEAIDQVTLAAGYPIEQLINRERRAGDELIIDLGLLRADTGDVEPEERRVRELIAELPDMRRAVDSGVGDPLEQAAYFDTLVVTLDAWSDAEFERISEMAGGIDLESTRRSIDAHKAATALATAAETEAKALAVAIGNGGVTTPSIRQELVRGDALADEAQSDLELLATVDTFDVWEQLRSTQTMIDYERARVTVLVPLASGDDADRATAATPQQLIDTFDVLFQRVELLDQVLDLTSNDIQLAATEARQDSQSDFILLVGAVTVVSIVTLLAVLMATRSITGPIRRLASHASAVNAGLYDGPAIPTSGPDEIDAVALAINNLTATMGTLEGQAEALADGRLEDPVLRADVPSPIAASLQASVDQLASAWADLSHRASHDMLTELPNRAAGRAMLAELVEHGEFGSPVGVMVVDVDRFKSVNDRYGNSVGDAILKAVAARLHRAAGDHPFAHLGADEFLLIVAGDDTDAELTALGKDLVAELIPPLEVDGLPVRLDASIGVARGVVGDATLDELLRDADLALLAAKQQPGSAVVHCDDRLLSAAQERLGIEASLRQAFEDGELDIWLQPIVDPVDRSVPTAEVLLRWTRGGAGVQPGAFIPVAEQMGLIGPVTQFALNQACAALARWTSQGRAGSLAVNVSALHIENGDLVGDVRLALERHDVAPDRLELEITESRLVENFEMVEEAFAELQQLGCRIAIDDFGTGYSSLRYLHRLPADRVKIDRSFVEQLDHGTDAERLIQLIAELGHALGLRVVAEGVETTEQLARLRKCGIDVVQGYLFAPPMPVATYEERVGVDGFLIEVPR